MAHKAVFLDRDGVINQDLGYVYKTEELKFIDGVIEALKIFRSLGFKLILVTNQSGIARGFFTVDDYYRFTEYMQGKLQEHGAQFDAVLMCPHLPGAPLKEYDVQCNCRKPGPGMILKAATEQDLDVTHSLMIGDHARDLISGKNAGVKDLILCGEHEKEEKEKLLGVDYRYFPDLISCARFYASLTNKSIS